MNFSRPTDSANTSPRLEHAKPATAGLLGNTQIEWQRTSGPVHYRSRDRLYVVGECYVDGRVMFRATFSGCLSCTPLGDARETAEQAKADAEGHYLKMKVAA